MLLGDDNGVVKASRNRIIIKDHRNFETYLERYRGLLLYLKEMDESAYAKICAVGRFTILTSPSCGELNVCRRTLRQPVSSTPHKSRPCFRAMAPWSRRPPWRTKRMVRNGCFQR